MRIRVITAVAFVLSTLAGAVVEAKKPIVAVFDIEFKRVRLRRAVVEVLNDYLADKVAASGQYQVVPRDQLKKRLVAQKKRSYKQCYKQSCQIEIGQELAAQKSMATRVMKIGGQCVVTVTLYDLKKATTERGAEVTGKCTEKDVMASIRTVVVKLARGGGSSPVTNGAGRVTRGPSVSGGTITKAAARLIVKVRPTTAWVRVTGSGGFSATGGGSWERADLKPGTYQVVAAAKGYASATRTVTMGADDLKTLTITLERPGTLEVTGKPVGSRVEISGPGGFSVVRGLPVTVSGATRGTYRIKVSRKGYRAVEREAVVSLGKTVTVTVTLVKGSFAGPSGSLWVAISGGNFDMGSISGASNEKPVHRVTIRSFSMMKAEVTVGQYRACVREGKCTKPDTGGYCNWDKDGRSRHPVNCIDWNQARSFCRWAGGRLPSEAEWEYVARSAGRAWKYPWGKESATCLRSVMNHGGWGCGMKRTWPVCSKTVGNTAQGLCDMAGNVWEWTEDCWHANYTEAPTDGSAWTRNCKSSRVSRGGSWGSSAASLRTADRHFASPRSRGSDLGLRCAR